MKNKTTKLFTVLTLILGITTVKATDRCVADNGAGGCYATISEAINAASDGDRIIIQPKAGGVAYAENLTISKTLEFLSDSEQVPFVIQGNISITPDTGRVITFIGMKNIAGNINPSGAPPAGKRCKVNIMNCEFTSGSVNFNQDNFDVSVVSSVFKNGTIALRFGKLIGNEITTTSNYYDMGGSSYTSLYIYSDWYASEDSILIIGNKISMNYVGTWWHNRYAVYIYNTSHYLYVSNNLIKSSSTSGYATDYALSITYAKNSSAGKNTLTNNTVDFSAVNTLSAGIAISSIYAASVYEMTNNIVLSNSIATNGIYGVSNSGVVSLSYNYMDNPLTIVGLIDNGTNVLNSNTTVDSTGALISGSDAINGGAPDESYYDHDLTRNDAGAYGGSFSLSNYHPVTGAARVYHVSAPRKITLGNTMNVKAESFDR